MKQQLKNKEFIQLLDYQFAYKKNMPIRSKEDMLADRVVVTNPMDSDWKERISRQW